MAATCLTADQRGVSTRHAQSKLPRLSCDGNSSCQTKSAAMPTLLRPVPGVLPGLGPPTQGLEHVHLLHCRVVRHGDEAAAAACGGHLSQKQATWPVTLLFYHRHPGSTLSSRESGQRCAGNAPLRPGVQVKHLGRPSEDCPCSIMAAKQSSLGWIQQAADQTALSHLPLPGRHTTRAVCA